MGRPSSYNEEKAIDICLKMAGGQSLKEICDQDDMPSRSTIYTWTSQFPEFRQALTRARIAHVDMLADEVIHIADNTVDAHRARNMIQARQWLASVINPKRYGQKLDVTVNDRPSLKDAMNQGSERLPLPVRDQLTNNQSQVIEKTLDFESYSPGYQPADDDEVDPFS